MARSEGKERKGNGEDMTCVECNPAQEVARPIHGVVVPRTVAAASQDSQYLFFAVKNNLASSSCETVRGDSPGGI